MSRCQEILITPGRIRDRLWRGSNYNASATFPVGEHLQDFLPDQQIGNLILSAILLGNNKKIMPPGHDLRRVLALVVRGEVTGGPRLKYQVHDRPSGEFKCFTILPIPAAVNH